MLYYGFGEQARHEHMSDEYKDRYIIIALLKTPPRYYRQYNTTVSSNTELNKRVVRSSTTKDLPNTHRRSTAETAMNPIGQTFPVIHTHLVGNSEHATSKDNVWIASLARTHTASTGQVQRSRCTVRESARDRRAGIRLHPCTGGE